MELQTSFLVHTCSMKLFLKLETHHRKGYSYVTVNRAELFCQ